MFENLDPRKVDDIIQRALDIIQGQKTTMLTLKMALDTDIAGFSHVNILNLNFPEGWFPLPEETFRGTGKAIVMDRTDTQLVIYYQIEAGSYFIKHSVEQSFSLHICYGNLTCSVSGGDMKKGATGQAKPNELHQLCFPEATGMTCTFDLT